MRSVISESVVRATFRLTAVSVLALTVAACSTDTTRFSQPMFSSANDYTGSITPKEGVGYGGARAPGTIASNADIQQAPLAAPGSYPSQPYPSQPYPQTSGGYGQGSGYTPPASQPIYSQPTYGQGQSTYSQPAYGAQPGSYQAGANVHAPTVMPDGSPGAVSSVRPSASATPHSGITVAVERGETLYSISRRYGVPVNALMQANGISDPTSVRVGQRLNIPQYSATKSGWVTGPQPVATRAVAPEPRAASRVATATKVDRRPRPRPSLPCTAPPAPRRAHRVVRIRLLPARPFTRSRGVTASA